MENALKDKAGSLADKMNKLTSKLDLSEELLVQGDDIVDYVSEKTKDIVLHKESSYADIMNLETMTKDFNYVRETLKETTDNARRVQSSITLDLISGAGDDEESGGSQASLIVSFAELSKAITDAQKLYILSYKEMSTTLLNLDKIKNNEKHETPKPGENHLHIHQAETMSTMDLINELRNKKETEINPK